MAEAALKGLNEQIKLVRQEAYAAGFDGAMRVEHFPKKRFRANRCRGGLNALFGRLSRPKRAPATAKVPKEHRTAAAPRRARGANTQLVKQVLQANAPRPMRPVEIRSAIQRDKGTSIAFTSIRQALDQLEARNVVEQVDGKTWRHHLGAGASDLSA